MVLNLKQLYQIPGERLGFDYRMNQDDLSGFTQFILAAPMAVRGEMVNRAGIVTLSYSAEFTLKHDCDRCLSAFERAYSYSFQHNVVRSLNGDDDDEYVVSEGDTLDLNPLVISDLLLQLPAKILCKDDCKGLCSICGAELNVSECGCKRN